MKSTFTVSVDTKTLEKFFETTHKQGVTKSAILQKLILEYFPINTKFLSQFFIFLYMLIPF